MRLSALSARQRSSWATRFPRNNNWSRLSHKNNCQCLREQLKRRRAPTVYTSEMPTEPSFDRRIRPHVLELFEPRGQFRPIVELALADRAILDIQLRRAVRSSLAGGECWISLYAGLSAILTFRFNSRGVKLDTHRTYQTELDSFCSDWLQRQPIEQLASQIDLIAEFAIDATAHVVSRGQFLESEGRVHAALAASPPDAPFRMADRESCVAFASNASKAESLAPILERYTERLAQRDDPQRWWPTAERLGTGCDFLGVDDSGRLLAVEAKPPNATRGIPHGPLQVAMYAELFKAWTLVTPESASIVNEMLAQRVALGLSTQGPSVSPNPAVVPVLAIGAGTPRAEGIRRMKELASFLSDCGGDLEPMEIWRIDSSGRQIDNEVIT